MCSEKILKISYKVLLKFFISIQIFFLALCLALYIFSLLPDQSSMFVRPQPYIIVLGAKATLAPSPFCGHQYTHSYLYGQ